MNFSPVLSYIEAHTADFADLLVKICEIPAPTFHERKRGQFLADLFQQSGFKHSVDEAGNVRIPFCESGKPHLVLSAHLDTVFTFDQIKVSRADGVLRAPGISDDSAGLAALVLLCRAFRHADLRPRGTLIFLATVGEEGTGNLRGARHYFHQHRQEIDYFISLDGSDAERIVTAGLASKRFRIYFRGPGGHSWGDAGTPNPIHAAGELLSRINRRSVPAHPKTTLNVGIIHGGTAVNAIPTGVYLDIDLRSEAESTMVELEQFLRTTTQELHRGKIETEIEVLGERPAGSIGDDHPLVKTAVAANRQFGLEAKLVSGSTDSNIPFALGIPALTMGVGGTSGKIHTPDEWYDLKGVEKGLARTALIVLQLLS